MARSDLSNFAISGTSGSSGFGSFKREQMERRTLEMVRAGDLRRDKKDTNQARVQVSRRTSDARIMRRDIFV